MRCAGPSRGSTGTGRWATTSGGPRRRNCSWWRKASSPEKRSTRGPPSSSGAGEGRDPPGRGREVRPRRRRAGAGCGEGGARSYPGLHEGKARLDRGGPRRVPEPGAPCLRRRRFSGDAALQGRLPAGRPLGGLRRLAGGRHVHRHLRALAGAGGTRRRGEATLSENGHDHAHEETRHERSPWAARIRAIEELLEERGVLSRREVEAQVEYMEARTYENGARIVARAWVDQAFKERLLSDTKAAAAELGVDASGTIEFATVENTDEVHNVIVCTLCSCYPRAILGRPPDWYKSFAYRSRAVREPRAVMREFGFEPEDGVEVAVYDSTADVRYMVLPMRPPGTDDMSEEELAELVTRDSLIGVSVPRHAGG